MSLTRYDEKFFDCRKSQIIAYLDARHVNVIPLFYNSYQSTAEIYRQLFIENKTKWKYSEPSLSDQDLARIGITPYRMCFESFKHASPYLNEKLHDQKVVFLWGDEYYLPYRAEAFHAIHSAHSLVVTGYHEPSCDYYVEDWDGLYGYLSSFHIESAFDSLPEQMRSILYLDIHEEGRDTDKSEDIRSFLRWLQAFEDDYACYDRIRGQMHDYDERRLTSMDHSFRLIAASRYVFSKFLRYIDYHPEEITALLNSHQLANNIATIVRRYMVARKIDWNSLNDRIRQLREQEEGFLQRLKRNYAS